MAMQTSQFYGFRYTFHTSTFTLFREKCLNTFFYVFKLFIYMDRMACIPNVNNLECIMMMMETIIIVADWFDD